MQVKPPTKKQLDVFVFGLNLILLFFAWKSYRISNFKLSFLLIAFAFFLLIIYLIKRDFVVEFYKIWMRVVSLIAMIITGILMIIIFYFVFAPVGILLRLLRKDVLNLGKDAKLTSYWIDRPQIKFDKANYERQF